MAAFASPEGTGSITATTVEITTPGNFAFNNFVEGRNPADPEWAWGTSAGGVTVTLGTDPSTSWTLTAQSVNDGNGNFANGKMWCDALGRNLDEAMYIKLHSVANGDSGYAYAGAAVTLTGSGNDLYNLGAVQNISHNDAIAGAGAYYIFVKVTVAYNP
jgi:hypothetical protein